MQFTINGCVYDRYYLLIDGIYPKGSCFVQTIYLLLDEKRTFLSKRKEGIRKDVERAFGILQARFAIVQNPSRQWNLDVIQNIMIECVILHNMILEDKEDMEGLENIIGDLAENNIPVDRGLSFEELIIPTCATENSDTHYSLKRDLIEHSWSLKGSAFT